MGVLPCAFLSPTRNIVKLSPVLVKTRDKSFMKENRCHSIPCRFLDSLTIHNRHPWCRSPCHRGSYSHHPSHRHSNSSRLRRCRCHTKLVPGQCCRGSGIHRTSMPGYSGHSSLRVRRLLLGKRQHLLYSSYWCHCLQTSWTGFFCASSEKRGLISCDSPRTHVWLREEFHSHCSSLCGRHSLSCLFPPCRVPVLMSGVEADVQVGFWQVHQLKDLAKWTGPASAHTWYGHW